MCTQCARQSLRSKLTLRPETVCTCLFVETRKESVKPSFMNVFSRLPVYSIVKQYPHQHQCYSVLHTL